MDITYRNNKLKKIFKDSISLCKKYGHERARKITQRIREFEAALNLHDINLNPKAKLHPLKGDRHGQYAVDVIHPFRLILMPSKCAVIDDDVSFLKKVEAVEFIEVVNYHED